jgi:hypothetical protein
LRQLIVHWKHLSGVYRSFFAMAVLLVYLRRVFSLANAAGQRAMWTAV